MIIKYNKIDIEFSGNASWYKSPTAWTGSYAFNSATQNKQDKLDVKPNILQTRSRKNRLTNRWLVALNQIVSVTRNNRLGFFFNYTTRTITISRKTLNIMTLLTCGKALSYGR